MSIKFKVFHKDPINLQDEYMQAESIAIQIKNYLSSEKAQKEIDECHKLNATSQQIQAIIQKELERIGFQSEKKGLFADYKVTALRPDFFLPIGKSGVILEVERGKTITNNMDLLDIWKCHVCNHADFLYLIVPNERKSESGAVIKAFDHVARRLSTFFESKNYINVEAVFIFGY